MGAFVQKLRYGVGWVGVAVFAANIVGARAEETGRREPLAAISTPAPAFEKDGANAEPEVPGRDLAPTGATTVAPPPGREVSRLDPERAPDPLSSAPLPPDLPPPSEIRPDAAPPRSPAAAPAVQTPVPSTPADAAAALADALRTALAYYAAQTPSDLGLDSRATREAIRAFYADRGFAPVWVDVDGLTPRGRALIGRLARAAEDGLDLHVSAPASPDFSQYSPTRLADIEAGLSIAAVSYALQASGARVASAAISPQVAARPAVADPRAALSVIAAASDPGQALLAFNPPQKGYRDLREQLARLRDGAPIASARLGEGPVLRIGMSDPRVPLIRARFGLGARPEGNAAEIYDVRVASAVAAFQRVHGLAADGALTQATSEALFGDPNARREALLLANMEMWRWEPRDMGRERVEINIPDFTLRVLVGDDEVHHARVIVGKPDTPTPIFSNEIKYILLNPVWHVPDSIIKKEMAPKLADDPDYLTKRGFKVTQVGDRLVVEQPPGEANALGRILFMFPNEHAVYLHDTPTRGLFATQRRAYSHGCIRVEAPARLAELVMGGAARGWTAARVQSMVGAEEKTVFLPRPLPIHIEYFTAFVDPEGELREREDVYGVTRRVAATLSRFRQD